MNVCTSAGHLANFSFSFLPLFCYRILSLIAVTRRLSSSLSLSRSFTIDRHVFTNTFETFHHGFLFQLLVRCLLPRTFIYTGSTTRGNCLSLFMQISFVRDILEFANKRIHLNGDGVPFVQLNRN